MWAPLPPVVSLGRLDWVHLRCTCRPLLYGLALPAGSTCNKPRSPATLPPCPGRVHRWSLFRSPAALPAFLCNTPDRVHQRSLSRSPATSSPSPRAPCPTGSINGLYPGRPLLRRPLPGPHALLTPVVHQSHASSPASPSPTPHAEPGRPGSRRNTKPPSLALSRIEKWINI
jgi:hypothetical protein